MDHAQVIAFAAVLEMEFQGLQRRLQDIATEMDLPTLEEKLNSLMDELPGHLKHTLQSPHAAATLEGLLATSYAEGVLTCGLPHVRANCVRPRKAMVRAASKIQRPEKAFGDVKGSGILKNAINSLPEMEKATKARSKVVSDVVKAQIVQDMRERLLKADGAGAEQAQAAVAEEAKRLADLSTNAHVRAHVDAQTQLAKGYGLFSAQQTREYLDRVPFQEFYRAEHRVEWRDWPTRWREQGGRFFPGPSDYPEGRMIAEVNSRIWEDLANPENYSDATGSPYPPFAYNSGMGVKPVGLAEALKLGLHGQHRVPRKLSFNAGISFSVDFHDDIKETLLDSVQDWVNRQDVMSKN